MTFHFDCLFYYVSDLDRAIRFYSEVLRFQLLSRDAVARFDVDGVLFELVPSSAPAFTGKGNARLCLRVDNLAEAQRDLQANGVCVDTVEDKGAGLLAAFHDPDGNEVCLWQYANR